MTVNKGYYYTDYNTFKKILENGTLRFKESTSSNDKLDTTQLFNSFKELAKTKLKNPDLEREQKFLFEMFEHNDYTGTRLSLVACFTSKKDSRLLWDAYTMHRKDRMSSRYNGVCIEFDFDALLEKMQQAPAYFDYRECREITYGIDKIIPELEMLLDSYSKEVDCLAKDVDQTQNVIPTLYIQLITKTIQMDLKKCIVFPTLHILNEFDLNAPFFKHEFWNEEDEIRALLSMKNQSMHLGELNQDKDGGRYYDLKIDLSCINNVILGPEMSEEDIDELRQINGSIRYEDISTIKSMGTGIIINR